MITDGTRWKSVRDPRVKFLREGSMVRVLINREPILFARVDGVLRAFTDICPHQGKSFEGGWVEAGHVVCPWHRLHFDASTGACRSGMTSNAHVFAVREEAEEVRIGMPYTSFSMFGWKIW
jgi:nitrite reductase/ring-hydroxylating ferredoxin subunit